MMIFFCRSFSQLYPLCRYLSVLDRQQLEMLCVRMIAKDPSNFEMLEAMTSHLDTGALLESIDTAMSDSAGSSYFFSKALSPMVDRATMYAKIGRINNALSALLSISSSFALCVCEDENIPSGANDAEDEEKEERQELDLFVAKLEQTWEVVAQKYSPTLVSSHQSAADKGVTDMNEVSLPKTHQDLFALLADWRVNLTPTFGPLFSDALRVVKKSIMKSEKEKEKCGDGSVAQKPAKIAKK